MSALLARGCDSNCLDVSGRTALQLAAGGGFTEMVALLLQVISLLRTMEVRTVVLQAGAAVDHQDEEDRDTPAHAASRYVVIHHL